MNISSSLQHQRYNEHKELLKLIHHLESTVSTNTTERKHDSEGTNLVLSRLLAKVHQDEINELREYIRQNLNPSSNAFQVASSALDDALSYVHQNADRLKTLQTSSHSLMESYLSSRDLSIHHNDGNGARNYTIPPDEVDLVSSQESPASSVSDASDKVPSTKKHVSSSHLSKRLIMFGILCSILRILFLDFPLASTALCLLSSYSARHIYNTYYVPIMQALEWTEERQHSEYTNYMRECDMKDVSTTNPDDLIIDYSTMTVDDAVHVTNKHGMAVFPNVISPESAAQMRDFVIRKNRALSEDEAIWLIANENRWSFAIGADQDPSVPPVLKEIAESAFLQATMEGLMGEDPAIVEFTAITSAYGATDQNWHADNEFGASQMHYARSFVSMYSLFIPLQDTTPEMGATSACPGTHLCGEESLLTDVCEELNFQVSDTRGRLATSEDEHTWKAGDGFLFNLNVYHRGPGHRDPNATERVMLIMTLSNRPKGPYFDRRQMSLGTSYSSRWDEWGLTINDLKVIDKIKGFPWKYLRSLGIYKPVYGHKGRDSVWGWDYLTVVCSRIINEQFGFRRDDLEVWTEKIKKKYGKLPSYLFGHLPEEGHYELNGWQEYIVETFERCIKVSWIAVGVMSLVYFIIDLVTNHTYYGIRRGLAIVSIIALCDVSALYYLQHTPWGQDITTHRAQEPPYVVEDHLFDSHDALTTLPCVKDVLVPTRLDSPFLAGMNIIFNHQIGNTLLNDLVSFYGQSNASGIIEKMLVDSIQDELKKNGSRFLIQNDRGDWEQMSEKDSIKIIRKALVQEKNDIVKSILQEIRFGKSDAQFGRYRSSIMFRKHGLYHLESIEHSIYNLTEFPKDETKSSISLFKSTYLRPSLKDMRWKASKTEKISKKDPSYNTHLQLGDRVEAFFEGDGWFKGYLVGAYRNKYAVSLNDGDYQEGLRNKFVRPFLPYKVGEKVLTSDGSMGIIARIEAIGYVEVHFMDDDNDLFDIYHLDEIRRWE